jgi:ribose 5-phosphate isomerase A
LRARYRAVCQDGAVGDSREEAKQAAGRFAAGLVQDGMRVGLGTGSTAHWLIVALAERRLDITCTATSVRSEELARSLGLTVLAADDIATLDIAIDGADEIDPEFNLVKGGGGAHLREKIIAQMATRFVVVADESKLVGRLGAFGVPLEVVDFAPGVVAGRVSALGAAAVTTREARSDNGNLLMDAHFPNVDDPATLARALEEIPGVVEHGIFLADTVDGVVIARADGSVREMVRPSR